MFRLEREISSVNPETIFTIGNFKISNTTLLSVLILIILLSFCFFRIRKFKLRPGKTQSVIEFLIEQMIGLIGQITGSTKHSKIIFPLIGAMFVYIGFSNLIGIVPGLTSITVDGKAIFRSPTADFNTTFGLALGSVVLLNLISIRDFGILGYLGKFFKFKEIFVGFKKSIMDGFMAIIDFGIGLLDIVGEIAKIVSLSLRLFGNMYAGEVLATLILGAFAYVLPLTWTTMSLLSGVIQALVFGSLVTAYYMLSIKPEEETRD